MEIARNWKDYEILDMSDGEKLERWGHVILIRPDPQIIWKEKNFPEKWKTANARYARSSSGGGGWKYNKKMPENWQIKYNDLTFNIKPMGFKHTGLFPEQAVNWEWMINKIKSSKKKDIKVLNLFVQREIRRGNKYDAIIMDPPSYGRGKNGEVWQFENNISDLVELCEEVLSDDPLFFLINSYTTGISSKVLENILSLKIKRKNGKLSSGEIGLPMKDSNLVLPCGIYGRWESK